MKVLFKKTEEQHLEYDGTGAVTGGRDNESEYRLKEKEEDHFQCPLVVKCSESDLLYTLLLKMATQYQKLFHKSFIPASRAPYGNLLM